MAFQQQSVGTNDPNVHDPRNNDIKDEESNADHGKMEKLKSFAQNTTLHGARFLFADNFFRRLLWAAAIVSCLGYCSYQVSTCVTEFYKRPFNTKITTNISTDGSELLFPSVTLCNLNSFNARSFRQHYQRSLNKETIDRQLKDISLLMRKSKEILNEDFKNRNPGLFIRQNKTKDTYHIQGMFAHQIKEMILPNSSQFESCSINGKHCDASNFTRYLSFIFGNCFTFNSGKDNNSLLYATLEGQNSGLKLRLNIERDSYLPNTGSPFVGLAILIHDQKTFPIVEEFGIKIQPGISTLCAIKRRKVSTKTYTLAEWAELRITLQ